MSRVVTYWFGDTERGIATGVGIMAIPSGIFISKILIMSLMQDGDKLPENRDEALRHYSLFLMINAGIVALFVLPSILLFKNKPMTPPSILA